MSKRSRVAVFLIPALVAVSLAVGCAEQKGRKKEDKKADKADKAGKVDKVDKSTAKQE